MQMIIRGGLPSIYTNLQTLRYDYINKFKNILINQKCISIIFLWFSFAHGVPPYRNSDYIKISFVYSVLSTGVSNDLSLLISRQVFEVYEL